MAVLGRFPFGARVRECGIEIPSPVTTFVLGAYPSALHVRWDPPPGTGRRVMALAVENEPSVFWDGDGAESCVEQWAARYFNPAWGTVSAPRGLNGSSGAWVRSKVVEPLHAAWPHDSRFLTDCLTTYRQSRDGRDAIEDRYHPFADDHPPLKRAVLPTHPSEDQIVIEALRTQRARLVTQVEAAAPAWLITLGDAAARVIGEISGWTGPGRIRETEYGQPRDIRIVGHDVRWFALCHPAAPKVYQLKHQEWLETGTSLWA
jgi:hypothetical protein